MLHTYCRGEKWKGRGCLEGRGDGSEKAVEEGGLQEQEYDSQITTDTFQIYIFFSSEKLVFYLLSCVVLCSSDQLSFDVKCLYCE